MMRKSSAIAVRPVGEDTTPTSLSGGRSWHTGRRHQTEALQGVASLWRGVWHIRGPGWWNPCHALAVPAVALSPGNTLLPHVWPHRRSETTAESATTNGSALSILFLHTETENLQHPLSVPDPVEGGRGFFSSTMGSGPPSCSPSGHSPVAKFSRTPSRRAKEAPSVASLSRYSARGSAASAFHILDSH